MPFVHSYIRVSSEEQKKSGLSIEAQQQHHEAYFRLMVTLPQYADLGLVWGERFAEDVSAWRTPFLKRPMGMMLDAALEPGDHVLFLHLDRGFRLVEDWARLRRRWLRRGITIHFTQQMIDLSTPHGRLSANVLASFSEYESDMKSVRTRNAKAISKAKGNYQGGLKPFGFKYIGDPKAKPRKLQDDPYERMIMREILRLVDEEKLGWKVCSNRLEAWLANIEGRKPMAHCMRAWPADRCRMAAKAERRLQAQEEAALARTPPLIRAKYEPHEHWRAAGEIDDA